MSFTTWASNFPGEFAIAIAQIVDKIPRSPSDHQIVGGLDLDRNACLRVRQLKGDISFSPGLEHLQSLLGRLADVGGSVTKKRHLKAPFLLRCS